MASSFLGKTLLGYKNQQETRRFECQKGRERTYNGKFSKVNSLRKERSGAHHEEENCLEFRHTKGDVNPQCICSLVTHSVIHPGAYSACNYQIL